MSEDTWWLSGDNIAEQLHYELAHGLKGAHVIKDHLNTLQQQLGEITRNEGWELLAWFCNLQ